MRINDIARIAGVTIRTVRHYHRVGLIAEPERDANNYRRYDVHHLVRLLRIRRFANLGFALDDIAELLDAGSDRAKDALAALDRELEAQIDQLTRRRGQIAELAASPDPPDVPAELAPFNELMTVGLPEDRRRVARDQSVLLAHLADRDEMPLIIDMFQQISQPERLETLLALGDRFRDLGADSGDADIKALVNDFTAWIRAIGADEDSVKSLSRPGAMNLIYGHALADSNAAQRRVMDEILRSF